MLLLSYYIDKTTPMFGGGEAPRIQSVRSLAKGESCNTSHFHFSNHAGTHIDLPSHFDAQGKSLSDYPAEFWLSEGVQVLQIELQSAELCTQAQLDLAFQNASIKNTQAEAVLLKTGWGGLRQDNKYWQSPPGFLPETATWLRNLFPRIKFFGFDLISLSSFVHRDVGREAHQAFLKHQQPILIIEDMNLEPLESQTKLAKLLVSPLLVSDADGSPVSVWAWLSGSPKSSL